MPATDDARAAVGRSAAITVITPIKPLRTMLLRLVLWLGTHVRLLDRKLVELSFIHCARWAIISDFPHPGPHAVRRRQRYDYLLFESNFNGTWDEYIDAFSEVVPDRMTSIWQSSYGFPGPTPVEPFKAYIRRNDLDVDHYYGAYPQASAKRVVAALDLHARLLTFRGQVAGVSAEEFAARYRQFVTDVQHLL